MVCFEPNYIEPSEIYGMDCIFVDVEKNIVSEWLWNEAISNNLILAFFAGKRLIPERSLNQVHPGWKKFGFYALKAW